MKDDDREEWLMQMDAPLPGELTYSGPSQDELQADADAFIAAQRALTAG